MNKNWPVWSTLLALCPAVLLVSCAAPPPHRQILQKPNPGVLTDNITITTAELNRIEHRAYDKGFADGKVSEQTNCSVLPVVPSPCPVTISCPAQATPVKPPVHQPSATKFKPPQTNTPPDYSTSGPAQPLSP